MVFKVGQERSVVATRSFVPFYFFVNSIQIGVKSSGDF
jgi:hypothetical protein